MIIEHKGDLHPQVIIEDDNGNRAAIHPLPEKAYLEVEEGQKIVAGTLLAKTRARSRERRTSRVVCRA
jgi:DNA-directed RNA polymerase subunit beta'